MTTISRYEFRKYALSSLSVFVFLKVILTMFHSLLQHIQAAAEPPPPSPLKEFFNAKIDEHVPVAAIKKCI